MRTEKKSEADRRCPACGKGNLEHRQIRDEFDYGEEGDRIRIVAEAVPVLVCPACEEVFYGREAELAHHRAICKALGLLTPEEITAVRERLRKSQAEFSQLTGIGVATLSRWENGRLLQSKALDNYLRCLDARRDPVGVLEELARRSGQDTAATPPPGERSAC